METAGQAARIAAGVQMTPPLSLTAEEHAARARADLRIGAPVALISPCGGASGGALVVAAETLSQARLEALRAAAPAALDLAITHRRAETLRARAYDGELARVAVPGNADAANYAIQNRRREARGACRGPTRNRGPGVEQGRERTGQTGAATEAARRRARSAGGGGEAGSADLDQ